MDLENVWETYGLNRFQEGLDVLFPQYDISVNDLLQRLLQGDLIGVLSDFLQQVIAQMAGETQGFKNLFVWLIALGILSTLTGHFVEVFDKNQVADLSFYFIYLFTGAILLKCLTQTGEIAVEALRQIVQFGKLLFPVYLVAISVSTGSLTAGAYYELFLLILYGVEEILLKIAVPLIYSYCMLAIINGIWVEEKLNLLIDLVGKLLGWIMKTACFVVTGIGIFQSLLAPVIDSVKKDAVGTAITSLPGIGNVTQGMIQLAVGSAVVIKNSVGVGLLVLLLFLCLLPLFKIFVFAALLKTTAAFMGIISDKRITACTNKIGEGAFYFLKLLGTAMFLFLITIAIVAMTTGKGM